MSLVRVVIPTYNRARLVSNAINSVLSQTLSNLEVVVVDDGSTDDTQAVVAAIAAKDTRIKCHRQENGGVASARNAGILYPGSFSYVAFLDADDEWVAADHLQKAVAAFEEDPEIDCIFARVETIDHAGQWSPEQIQVREERYSWPQYHSTKITSQGAIVIDTGDAFWGLLTGDVAPHTSTVVLRVARIGIEAWFDIELEVFEDINLFTRLARRYVFAFFDSIHVHAQYHGDNLTKQHPLHSPITLRRVRSMLLHAQRTYPLCLTAAEKNLVSHAIANQGYLVGQCLAEQGKYREARSTYLRALWQQPSLKVCRSLVKATIHGLLERR